MDGPTEEILSSSDEQVNITVSTDNDPESPIPVNKQRTQPNFVLDKFGTESSSESGCLTSHSNVGRYSKKGRQHDNNRATESRHMMGSSTFPINKQSKLYNSTPRKQIVKPSAVEKNRESPADKSFGSAIEKRKNGNQRLKRRLSLSPNSEELPTICRPKQRRVCRPQSRPKFMITSDTNTSSSDSETCDGKRSFVVSGAKINDTNALETFSYPDVQVLSLSSSDDSDLLLVELLKRRKEKESLSTRKSSGKSDEKSIKFDLASVKQAIVSLGYVKKTLPSTSMIDEQSKDIGDDDSNKSLIRDTRDSDEQDKQKKRNTHLLMERLKMTVKSSEDGNEDDNKKTSLKNTEDPIKDDKQKKMRINSLLDKLKETINSIKKDNPLAIESPSPASVSLSSSLHPNTGKIVENFGKKINENEKNGIHEKTNQVQNMEIDTLDIPELVLVTNKKQVGADVSVHYAQEPECIFIHEDDDTDDGYIRSLSQRVTIIDEDDGDREGEEEKKQCYADDEGIVEDVKVKIEMDSEGFEIKDPEFWEDYAQMSEEDFDGYGDLVEPSLMETVALGTEKKIKTESDTFKPEGDGEKVSAGINVMSSKENDHSLGIKTEIHSDVDSGHDKEEDDGLSGANVVHSK